MSRALALSVLLPLAHAFTCFHYQRLTPGTRYSVASPGWPLSFQPGESCQWVAEAPPDQRVSIECDEFNLPGPHSNESHSCCEELLISETGSPISLDGMPYVGQGVVVTSGNLLNMELKSTRQSATADARFHCSVCATQEHQWEVHNRASDQPTLPPAPAPGQDGSCPCGWRLDGRLTGGLDVKPNEFPMMAGLAEGSTVFCGAVLVASRYALTSAHCLRGKSIDVVDMVVGDFDFSLDVEGAVQQRLKLVDFIKHPQWSSDWRRANIAIAKTRDEIRMNFFTVPACMPTKATDSLMQPGDYLLALGWGAETYTGTTSNRLKFMHAILQDNKECESKYQTYLQEEHFCIGSQKGQAVCTGDPGGPLLLEDSKTHRLTVVGIIAYGEGCTGASIINTRVSSYLEWIRDVTGNTTCSTK